MKTTYIQKAQEVYEKVLNEDIEIYKFFITSVLTSFGIKNNYQLDILSNCLKGNDARYLYVNFHNGGKYNFSLGERIIQYDFSFKDNIEFETLDIQAEDNEFNIDLNKQELYERCRIDDIKELQDSSGIPGVYSLLASIKLWDIISLKYNIDDIEQIKPLSYSSKELMDVFKRSFGEYCVRLMWKNNIEDLYNYCDAITLQFFIYLWKSIAIGEFYIVPDYGNKINIIKEDSEKTYGRILPAFTSYYPEICSSFNTFINRIKPYDKKEDGIVYNIDTNPKTTANKVIDTYSSQFIKTKMLKPLIELTEQLFEMTVIDLNYSASEKNIAILVDFISSLNILKTQSFNTSKSSNAQSASIHLKKHIDSTALAIFENVIELLLYKTSILINQIIKQTEDVILKPKTRVSVLCNRYRLANDKINNIISRFSLGSYEEDPFYTLYCNHRNKDLNISQFSNIKIDKATSDYWWIKYNTNIEHAIELRKINSHLLYSIHCHQEEALTEIRKFVKRQGDDKNKYEYKYTSPSTYIKAIVWLYDYINLNKGNENHSEISLFGELLKCFRRYINMYKNINSVPQTFRSYFEYSFCTKQENTLKKFHIDSVLIAGENTLAIKDCIFFASIGYQPFNIDALETCFYFYNLELKSLERKSIEASLETSKSATEQAKKAIDEIGKSIQQYNNIKGKADKLTEQIEEERKNTLQLVGLLGVFIAFVSSTVGTQTVATDIYKFILFAFTFATGILVFIFSISFIMQKQFEWKKFHTANAILIGILVICIIIISLIVMPSESNSSDHKVIENTESPTNENQKAPSSDTLTDNIGCSQDHCNDIVNGSENIKKDVVNTSTIIKKDTSANNRSNKQKTQPQPQPQ